MFCGIAERIYMKIVSICITGGVRCKKDCGSLPFSPKVSQYPAKFSWMPMLVLLTLFINCGLLSHAGWKVLYKMQNKLLTCQETSFLAPCCSSFPIQKFLWWLSYYLALLMGLWCSILIIFPFQQIFCFPFFRISWHCKGVLIRRIILKDFSSSLKVGIQAFAWLFLLWIGPVRLNYVLPRLQRASWKAEEGYSTG